MSPPVPAGNHSPLPPPAPPPGGQLLAHGVSNLHTLQILDDGDVDSMGMLPAVAKLFKTKHKQLAEDLAKLKGRQPLTPSEEEEAERRRRREEFRQDVFLFAAAGITAIVVIAAYVFSQPPKAGKAD